MKKSLIDKEWERCLKLEERYVKKATEKSDSKINKTIQEKVPEKVNETLEKAFAKALDVVVSKGTGVIEKTYNKQELEYQFKINEFTNDLKHNKQSLRKFTKDAEKSKNMNAMASSVKGVGLGFLGIGVPDIPVFIATIFKGIYEISLSYGFDYNDEQEQYFILQIIKTSLMTGDKFLYENAQVNQYIVGLNKNDHNTQCEQIVQLSQILTNRVLSMKFVQGIPVVGAVAGVLDGVYIGQILDFAKIKYQKRFLYNKKYNLKYEPLISCEK